MRKLSQAASRGTLQVLQSPLQYDLQRQAVGYETCDRGTGAADGNISGLVCEWCGKPLPAGCTIRREFCDKVCRQSFYTEQKRQAREAGRKDRKCLWCGGSMDTPYHGRIYCSERCKQRSGSNLTMMGRAKRICAYCGKAFRPPNPDAKFCSHACYCDNKRTRWPKVCPACGVTFTPHLVEQVACSKACQRALTPRLPDRQCVICGTTFTPRRASQHCCSKGCAAKQAGLTQRGKRH